VEALLEAANDLLAPLERRLTAGFSAPGRPVVFLVGLPRSGSTLLSQLLARSGALGYVSNFVARFWKAPYVGALIERGVAARKLYERLGDDVAAYRFRFGVTPGWSGPHEFGYFWSRWFPFENTHKLGERELAGVDGDGLSRSVASLEEAYRKPMFFKFLANTLHIPFLAKLFPRSLFVATRRDLFYNAQSLVLSRKELYGSPDAWFSTRPEGYQELRLLEWPDQVAGQVASIHEEMETALRALPSDRKVDVSYDELCARPRLQVERILDAVEKLERRRSPSDTGGLSRSGLSRLPDQFENTDGERLPAGELFRLRRACKERLGPAGASKRSGEANATKEW
jgi:hypothetical protein